MDELNLYASNEKSLEVLIETVHVFSNGIGMEYGVEKCAVLTMKKGNMANSDGMALLNKTTIERLKEGHNYKYLEVMLADATEHH